MKSFVLHDESVNTYGFRMLTRGCDLSEFQKNPVMFYNHDATEAPIGRWENIRIEEDRILADPVFDLDDPFAQKIALKVEKGFIKAASVGAWVIESTTDPALLLAGQTEPTVTKWALREASICNIPANHNALALYDADGEKVAPGDIATVLQLTDNPQSIMNVRMTNELQTLLALSDTATDTEIVGAVKTLTTELDALRAYKASAELTAKQKDEEAFHKLSARLTPAELEPMKKLFAADPAATLALLSAMPEPVSVQKAIENAQKSGASKLLADKTWSELDREGRLAELYDKDPELYSEKFREQFGRDPQN